MKKKINILFTQSTNHIAGGEINLISLLNTIDKNIFRIYLLSNQNLGIDVYLKNQKVCIIPFKFPIYKRWNFSGCLRFLFLILRYKINIVYFNTISDLKIIGYLLKLMRIPCIVHLHIVEKALTLRWVNLKLAQRILFPSLSTMDTVLAGSPWIGKKKCYFVHNGVDVNIYYPKETLEIRKELSLKNDLPIVGIVGQLKQAKGQHLFLEMVKKLAQKDIKINFLIIGDDNIQKGKYLKVLKGMAIELNIQDQVEFLGYRKDIPEIMSLCDLIVVPSLREPFGRVVIEAMACGTPVVASKVGGMKEIFEDGKGGLYCEVNSVKSLTEKVLYFFQHPDWWQDQKRIAYVFCMSKYKQEVHTKKIEKHILETIGVKNA